MALKDAVEEILKAEAEGKKLIAEARLKAEKILTGAETRARGLVDEAMRGATDEARKRRQKALADAEGAREKMLEGTESRLRLETADMKRRADEAAEAAMEQLLK